MFKSCYRWLFLLDSTILASLVIIFAWLALWWRHTSCESVTRQPTGMAKHEAGRLRKSHWSPRVKHTLYQELTGSANKYKISLLYIALDLRYSFQKYASCLNICIISSYFERIFYWYARKCSLYLFKVLKVFFSWRGFITRKEARSWELVLV